MHPLQKYLVSPSATILDVLSCIDHNTSGIAMVMEADAKLIGTITDGDIRRALLAGKELSSPIKDFIRHNFHAVGPFASRVEVLDLMRASDIKQIPIVDAEGKLLGLHVMREIIGAVERPNWAVIMSGGRGERLRPLTDLVPKPMLRVAGRPILERIVLHLVGHGIREIFLSVNYLGMVIEKYFGDGSSFGCNIRYLQEDQPLGTGGALSLLPEKPSTPILVMNGDLVTQANIGEMLQMHTQGEHDIMVGAQEYLHTVPYGCLKVSEGYIISLEEKPVITRLINTGIYTLSPHVIERVPQNRAFPITELIENSITLGERVGVFRLTDDWVDVGQRDQLESARSGRV